MPAAMRYRDPEVQQRLAFAYVAGTLSAATRKRFDSLRHEVPELDRLTWWWGQHLQPLADRVPERAPRSAVWKRIAAATDHSQSPASSWRERASFLKGLTAVATVIVILLSSALLVQRHQLVPTIDYVAVLENDAGLAMFVATTSGDTRLLTIKALVPASPEGEEDWQLWAISKTDGEPRSVGLLERDGITVKPLTETGWRLITDAASLLITAEARGGSAIGEPNDHIISSGACIRLSESEA